MAKTKEKKEQQTYEQRLRALKKKHEDGIFIQSSDPERVPTRFLRIDHALGGGLPKGRTVELYGPEGGFKSTMCLCLLADIAKATGKIPIYMDHEHRFTGQYAEQLGVLDVVNRPLSDWVLQPRYFEEGADVVCDLVQTGEVGVVVLDSIAALGTKAEVEGTVEQHHMAVKARKIAQFLYKFTPILTKTGVILLTVNQVRTKPGVMFGNPEETPGGRTLKHHASIRLRLGPQKVKDKPDLMNVGIRFIKNSITGQYPEFVYRATRGNGFDLSGEVLDGAVACGLASVKPGGGYIVGKKEFKNRTAAIEAVMRDKVREQIEGAVRGEGKDT